MTSLASKTLDRTLGLLRDFNNAAPATAGVKRGRGGKDRRRGGDSSSVEVESRLAKEWKDLSTPLSPEDPLEIQTREELTRIYKERADRHKAGSGRALAIPRFHRSAKTNEPFSQTLFDAAREKFITLKNRRLLHDEELEHIHLLLRENLTPAPPDDDNGGSAILAKNSLAPASVLQTPIFEGLNYDDFERVGRQVPLKAAHFFSPQIFLCFRRDRHGRISMDEFYKYIDRHCELSLERITFLQFDDDGDGYLREEDLEEYFLAFIQQIPSLHALQKDFQQFYIFTAVRRFFFFLDRHGQRKLAIKDILGSPVFQELQELRRSDWDEELPNFRENWFSAYSSLRVYREYLELDADHNGMLKKSELASYNNGSLTPLFIDRLWQEYRTYGNEMDYKLYLDFSLAMENQKSPQSIRWFWRLLDIRKEGRINATIIKMFFDEVLRGIERANQAVDVTCDDVCDEIFDMVKPADPRFITVQDLIRCGVGDMVISMLIDTSEFLSFEQQEVEGD